MGQVIQIDEARIRVMSHIECAKSLAALNECTMKHSFAELDFLRFARGTLILVQLPSC